MAEDLFDEEDKNFIKDLIKRSEILTTGLQKLLQTFEYIWDNLVDFDECLVRGIFVDAC